MSPVDDEAVTVHYSGRVIFNPDGFILCATDSLATFIKIMGLVMQFHRS